jgi:hypothetical protein
MINVEVRDNINEKNEEGKGVESAGDEVERCRSPLQCLLEHKKNGLSGH